MSEETARIYNHARRSPKTSREAWDDLGELAEEVDWDVKQMLSDEEDAPEARPEQELPE